MLFDLDDHQLGCRGITYFGDCVYRHQNIGLGVISCGITFGDIIGNDYKQSGNAFFAAVVVKQVDLIPCFKTGTLDVAFIHKNNAALIVNTPVAVFQPINGGIKLVVAADAHHNVFIRRQFAQPRAELAHRRYGRLQR